MKLRGEEMVAKENGKKRVRDDYDDDDDEVGFCYTLSKGDYLFISRLQLRVRHRQQLHHVLPSHQVALLLLQPP